MCRGSQLFQKSWGHLQILDARRVRWSKFQTEDPILEWRVELLSGALCPLRVKWYTFLHARDNKTRNIRTTWQWEAFVQPLLLWKGYKYYILSVCLCSLRYCLLRPARLFGIFPHFLINGKIFERKSFMIKCGFWFSVQILSETFLILRRTEWDMIRSVYWSSCKVPSILVRI